MLIYILPFLISIFLLYLSDKIKVKYFKRLLVFIALFIPSFIAGARDFGVGRDTVAYAQASFNWANIYGFSDYIIRFSDSYLLYSIWYIIARFTNSTFLFFFVPEFAIEVLIYLSIIEDSKDGKSYAWLGMLVYYFVFYTYSLSLIRQSIAVAFMLFAYQKFMKRNKPKRYILANIFAFFIHPTSLICLVIVATERLFDRYLKWSFIKQMITYIITVFVTVIIVFQASKIVNLLILWNTKYMYYREHSASVNGTFVSWIFYFVLFLWILISSKIMNTNRNKKLEFFLVFFGLSIFWINIIANNAYRVSFYYLIPILILYPSSYKKAKGTITTRNNRIILTAITMSLCFVIWYVMTVKWQMNDIIPYHSKYFGG